MLGPARPRYDANFAVASSITSLKMTCKQHPSYRPMDTREVVALSKAPCLKDLITPGHLQHQTICQFSENLMASA
jgi:hypothetical protein